MEEHTTERITFIDNEKDAYIKLSNASFSWGFKVKENQNSKKAILEMEEVSEPALRDINLDLKHDDLIIVVGQVGAGKTTLLYSIMEETPICSGSREITGTIAYVEQEPFIYSETIK